MRPEKAGLTPQAIFEIKSGNIRSLYVRKHSSLSNPPITPQKGRHHARAMPSFLSVYQMITAIPDPQNKGTDSGIHSHFRVPLQYAKADCICRRGQYGKARLS